MSEAPQKFFLTRLKDAIMDRDYKGIRYQNLDKEDGGKRYRNLMLKRTFIVAVLVSLPWVHFLHSSPPPQPTKQHEIATKTVSSSDFITDAQNHKLGNIVVTAQGGWQVASANKIDGTQENTLFPLADSSVIHALRQTGTDISYTAPESQKSKVATILSLVGSLFIFMVEAASLIIIIMMMKQFMKGNKFHFVRRKGLSLDDVAGIQDIRERLEEIVSYARHGGIYDKLKAQTPRGWLFTGPPGVGKTLTAEAISAEAGIPFLKVSGSSFVEMFVGLGAKRVRDMKKQALKMARKTGGPVIIFIDEVDAIAGARGSSNSHGEREQTLNELLVAANGADTPDPIIWIAATNRHEMLDGAFLRRFSEQIQFALPDLTQRKELLRIAIQKKDISIDVDTITEVAKTTAGFSGDDIAKLVNGACLEAGRRNGDTVKPYDFTNALDKKLMGIERKGLMSIMDENEKLRTAVHEAGHALVTTMLSGCHPVYKATIIPHGVALGMVVSRPERDQISRTKKQMKEDLARIMAGHAAEEIYYQDKSEVSSGPVGDIQQATRMAYAMVAQYGMGDIGYVALEEIKKPSDNLLQSVDRQVMAMIEDAQKHAQSIIIENKEAWVRIYHALMEKETLTGEEVMNLIDDGKNDEDLNKESERGI